MSNKYVVPEMYVRYLVEIALADAIPKMDFMSINKVKFTAQNPEYNDLCWWYSGLRSTRIEFIKECMGVQKLTISDIYSFLLSEDFGKDLIHDVINPYELDKEYDRLRKSELAANPHVCDDSLKVLKMKVGDIVKRFHNKESLHSMFFDTSPGQAMLAYIIMQKAPTNDNIIFTNKLLTLTEMIKKDTIDVKNATSNLIGYFYTHVKTLFIKSGHKIPGFDKYPCEILYENRFNSIFLNSGRLIDISNEVKLNTSEVETVSAQNIKSNIIDLYELMKSFSIGSNDSIPNSLIEIYLNNTSTDRIKKLGKIIKDTFSVCEGKKFIPKVSNDIYMNTERLEPTRIIRPTKIWDMYQLLNNMYAYSVLMTYKTYSGEDIPESYGAGRVNINGNKIGTLVTLSTVGNTKKILRDFLHPSYMDGKIISPADTSLEPNYYITIPVGTELTKYISAIKGMQSFNNLKEEMKLLNLGLANAVITTVSELEDLKESSSIIEFCRNHSLSDFETEEVILESDRQMFGISEASEDFDLGSGNKNIDDIKTKVITDSLALVTKVSNIALEDTKEETTSNISKARAKLPSYLFKRIINYTSISTNDFIMNRMFDERTTFNVLNNIADTFTPSIYRQYEKNKVGSIKGVDYICGAMRWDLDFNGGSAKGDNVTYNTPVHGDMTILKLDELSNWTLTDTDFGINKMLLQFGIPVCKANSNTEDTVVNCSRLIGIEVLRNTLEDKDIFVNNVREILQPYIYQAQYGVGEDPVSLIELFIKYYVKKSVQACRNSKELIQLCEAIGKFFLLRLTKVNNNPNSDFMDQLLSKVKLQSNSDSTGLMETDDKTAEINQLVLDGFLNVVGSFYWTIYHIGHDLDLINRSVSNNSGSKDEELRFLNNAYISHRLAIGSKLRTQLTSLSKLNVQVFKPKSGITQTYDDTVIEKAKWRLEQFAEVCGVDIDNYDVMGSLTINNGSYVDEIFRLISTIINRLTINKFNSYYQRTFGKAKRALEDELKLKNSLTNLYSVINVTDVKKKLEELRSKPNEYPLPPDKYLESVRNFAIYKDKVFKDGFAMVEDNFFILRRGDADWLLHEKGYFIECRKETNIEGMNVVTDIRYKDCVKYYIVECKDPLLQTTIMKQIASNENNLEIIDEFGVTEELVCISEDIPIDNAIKEVKLGIENQNNKVNQLQLESKNIKLLENKAKNTEVSIYSTQELSNKIERESTNLLLLKEKVIELEKLKEHQQTIYTKKYRGVIKDFVFDEI